MKASASDLSITHSQQFVKHYLLLFLCIIVCDCQALQVSVFWGYAPACGSTGYLRHKAQQSVACKALGTRCLTGKQVAQLNGIDNLH